MRRVSEVLDLAESLESALDDRGAALPSPKRAAVTRFRQTHPLAGNFVTNMIPSRSSAFLQVIRVFQHLYR